MKQLDIQYSIWTILSEAMRKDSEFSMKDVDNLPAIAYNGEKKCDVLEGPCSCQAWHELNEPRDFTFFGKILIEQYQLNKRS